MSKRAVCFAMILPSLCLGADKAPGADAQWIEDLGGAVVRNASGAVTEADLRSTWVSDTDLRRLLRYPSLETLDLSLTRVTDQGIQELRGLPGIRELRLRFAESVTDEGLAAIKGWKKLRHLDVHGTKISDTTLEHISGITALESLDIGSAMITDVGLERLASLTNLKKLTMGGNELGDAGLQALRQMPGLTYLDLSGRQGTDSNVWAIAMSEKGLEAVMTLAQLEELRFGCTSIGIGVEGTRFATVSAMSVTTRWLERLKTLRHLKRLTLQGCDRVDDEAVPVLSAFPSLNALDLKGTAVSEKGLAAIREAKPKLQVLTGAWDAKAANFRNN